MLSIAYHWPSSWLKKKNHPFCDPRSIWGHVRRNYPKSSKIANILGLTDQDNSDFGVNLTYEST